MKRRIWSCLLVGSFGSLPLALSTPARAVENDATAAHPHVPLPGSDGVYGRLDGSLALKASIGSELERGEPRGALRLSAHYLWTAGAYTRYSDALGTADLRPARVLSFGVDVRPLFLPRFGLDLEHGPAFVDLLLDSLSLTAGAYFAQPVRADFGDERGFETGVGCGVPLSGEARGLWLDARAERRFADHGSGAWLFTLALSWDAVVLSTNSAR